MIPYFLIISLKIKAAWFRLFNRALNTVPYKPVTGILKTYRHYLLNQQNRSPFKGKLNKNNYCLAIHPPKENCSYSR